MLKVLHEIEKLLPSLLKEEHRWQSLLVDYHPPIVERLWTQYGDLRVYLHCILPCAEGEALYHPHLWPSAVKILSGSYEMIFGTSDVGSAAKIVLMVGSEYEMTEPRWFYSVRPLGGPSMSLMVAGKLYRKVLISPGSKKELGPLSVEQRNKVWKFFYDYYCKEKKFKYRVVSSRFDVLPEVAGGFEASSDELAKLIFDERFKKNKNYDFDWLDLLRIDQEEKTTRIDGRG